VLRGARLEAFARDEEKLLVGAEPRDEEARFFAADDEARGEGARVAPRDAAAAIEVEALFGARSAPARAPPDCPRPPPVLAEPLPFFFAFAIKPPRPQYSYRSTFEAANA
jgi:hypothetical protein